MHMVGAEDAVTHKLPKVTPPSMAGMEFDDVQIYSILIFSSDGLLNGCQSQHCRTEDIRHLRIVGDFGATKILYLAPIAHHWGLF